MKKIYRQLVLAIGAATAMQACYGQLGIALGAGAEQWNRQRELDMQERQIELQRQRQELEIEQYKRENDEHIRRQAQAEEQRRRHAEEQRQQEARRDASRSRKEKIDALISNFEKTRGQDGAAAAAAIRGQIYGASLFKPYPDISEQQVLAALEEKTESIRRIREAREKIAIFLASKKEYAKDEHTKLFNEELNNSIDMIDTGKIQDPGSFEKLLEITHQRVKKIIQASKSGKRTSREI